MQFYHERRNGLKPGMPEGCLYPAIDVRHLNEEFGIGHLMRRSILLVSCSCLHFTLNPCFLIVGLLLSLACREAYKRRRI